MTNNITRRTALTAGLAASAASCSGPSSTQTFSANSDAAEGVFAHGVASGDPAADSVVIWTRVSPPPETETGSSVTVVWETASDAEFSDMLSKGEAVTSASRDWTVKVLLAGLKPGSEYYYRFRIGDTHSSTGRTRTLPEGAVAKARFAVVSCANFAFGYFNVYDLISRRDDFDAVIHLGDYIYEHGSDGYAGEAGAALGRNHSPTHEIITLDDYRRRHGQYKSDPSSQAMHAAHAIIPIWDDHETANNSWKAGADNHQPETEGDWDERRRAALQAYYEWMPVREPAMAPEAFFRSYRYGDLLTLCAIETRLMARTQPFEYTDVARDIDTQEDADRFKDEVLWNDNREMLGGAQLDYLDRELRASAEANQPWRLIANQVLMAEVISPDLNPFISEEQLVALEQLWDQARAFVRMSALGLPSNFDAWDGYPAARERFYAMIKSAGAQEMIVLTGDTHTWWANDLTTRDGTHMGVELGVHSVTSPSEYAKDFLGGKGDDFAMLTNRDNKQVRYLSGEGHGFIDLTVEHDKASAEFIAVDNIESPDYSAFSKAKFSIKRAGKAAKFSGVSGLGPKERVLFG